MQRRDFMIGAGAATLATLGAAAPPAAAGTATAQAAPPGGALADPLGARTPPPAFVPTSGTIAPVRARTDRIARITVCTRPFRAQGPRIEREKIAGREVIHNYGHGGSGWSLSWGSAWRPRPRCAAPACARPPSWAAA